MGDKDKMDWILVEEDNLETTEDQQLMIGNDDPTVRTAALPDIGIDSAVHDVGHLRRLPTADV